MFFWVNNYTRNSVQSPTQKHTCQRLVFAFLGENARGVTGVTTLEVSDSRPFSVRRFLFLFLFPILCGLGVGFAWPLTRDCWLSFCSFSGTSQFLIPRMVWFLVTRVVDSLIMVLCSQGLRSLQT